MNHQIYSGDQHSPTEHFARVAYRHLAKTIDSDAEMEDDPERLHRHLDAMIVDRLRGAKRLSGSRKAAPPKIADGAREGVLSLAGVRIGWHQWLPELSVWAGRMSLAGIVARRMAALWENDLPAAGLATWEVPLPTASGLDPRSVYLPIDIGFSLDHHDEILVSTYAAAELLQVIGMELAPITRLANMRYGYQDHRGRWWQFTIERRGTHHRYLSMSSRFAPEVE